MDLDLWNGEFQLAGDWDLDVPDLDVIGQFGDLKQGSNLDGVQSLRPQDGISDFSHFKEEDGLGLSNEWMESTDIASFFDALGDHPGSLLESSLLDIETDIIAESSSKPMAPVPNFFNSNGGEDCVIQLNNCIDSQKIFLSPPDSPIEEHAGLKNGLDTVNIVVTNSMLENQKTICGEEITISGGDIFLEVQENEFESNVFSHSEMSSDCTSSSLHSFPSSPESNKSIFQSSPELFKVISASPVSHRYAPYELQKCKPPTKSSNISKRSRKTKAPAQPVPEHVIMEESNKKDRKKLQNKNAAIRYRMKKKEEAEEFKSEEQELEDVNCQLKTKVDDLEREIRYMKNLMQDIFKAKGIKV